MQQTESLISTIQPASDRIGVFSQHLMEPNTLHSVAESWSPLSHSALQYKPHTLLCLTQLSDVHYPLANRQKGTSRTVPLCFYWERWLCLALTWTGVWNKLRCVCRPVNVFPFSLTPKPSCQRWYSSRSSDYSVIEVRLWILQTFSLLER